ncbi:MAG TPA: radical SAM protein [Candidatus Paceibacterota bacterium]|nr:radical SAM protein [Candidatus Paceibacterota bacterium]
MTNKNLVRDEIWGRVIYNHEDDEFSAEVMNGTQPLPASPIGIGWIIIGGCNLKCLHCYGNIEELPSVVLSTNECIAIAERIIEARVMRVVISGGEPLLRDDIFSIIQKLVEGGVSVVLGTNGSFIERENVESLSICTRVEISLDAATSELNNKIRPSRQKRGNAWQETLQAIKLCVKHNTNLRILTALNTWNQSQIVEMAAVLNDLGVKDWALSWTIPAGRARLIYDQFRPEKDMVEEGIEKARKAYPSMIIRYSHRESNFNRFYCLILPDGQIATEDISHGGKLTFGSLREQPIASAWNSNNYDIPHHFEKWVGDRIKKI